MGQILEFCRLRCPECYTTFPAEIMRSTGSGGVLESDLCYRAGNIFPYPFFVVVCPGCRFAAYHQEFDFLCEFPHYSEYHPLQRALGTFLREQRRLYPGSEKYRLAVQSAQKRGAGALAIAYLHLRGSWCAREEKNREAERYHQEEARRHFGAALSGLTGMEAAIVGYLIGEISRRLGEFDRALVAFASVDLESLPEWLRPGFLTVRERAACGDGAPQILRR
ncbi:DUF2225 domain-containing protein [Thermodesulfitimonas sp.]